MVRNVLIATIKTYIIINLFIIVIIFIEVKFLVYLFLNLFRIISYIFF